ncbi:hypothetical protein [Globicatella sp. HMSC072A10]|nr:hypothetical protein [Globicatella sp. HMSC072A10]
MKCITIILMQIKSAIANTSGDKEVNSTAFTSNPKIDNFGGVMSES